MNLPRLHPWDLDYESARRLQMELRHWLDLRPHPLNPQIIAGCDVSAEKGSALMRSAVVVLSFPDFKTLEIATAECETRFPYIPGLLSFREMPALLSAWEKVETAPDLVFCDGSGTIHPRKFGLACHLGLWLNLPTIGCAKGLLCGEHYLLCEARGSQAEVILAGEIVGSALRTRTGVKPVFISPGNLISLEQAIDFTLQATPRYRLPQPIRRAHFSANPR